VASWRLAFTVCNGSEQGNTWESLAARNERWLHLAMAHAERLSAAWRSERPGEAPDAHRLAIAAAKAAMPRRELTGTPARRSF